MNKAKKVFESMANWPYCDQHKIRFDPDKAGKYLKQYASGERIGCWKCRAEKRWSAYGWIGPAVFFASLAGVKIIPKIYYALVHRATPLEQASVIMGVMLCAWLISRID